MEHTELQRRFAGLTTAHIADGCIRAGVDVRCAPAVIQARVPGTTLVGRALPARHVGSVDVFLEAFVAARAGDVLVVDNGGRVDESCVGDLVTLEAVGAGVSGILISDGALFVPADRVDAVLGFAETIRDTERAQAVKIEAGTSLRDQVRFSDYLSAREANPRLTFRDHLKSVGGAIEV